MDVRCETNQLNAHNLPSPRTLTQCVVDISILMNISDDGAWPLYKNECEMDMRVSGTIINNPRAVI